MNIILLGKPRPKLRPRLSQWGVYDCQTREKKSQRRELCQYSMIGNEKSGYSVKSVFYFQVPKSWSKKKKAMALKGEVLHITKPDTDNLTKFLYDNMSGIIFPDDRQIVREIAEKRYAIEAKTVVEIEEITTMEQND